MKMSTAAVAVWLAFAPVEPAPQPSPAKCCGKCNNTGMVWSGDGLQRLQCPCPATCPCAKNRPKMTLKGPVCEGPDCKVR